MDAHDLLTEAAFVRGAKAAVEDARVSNTRNGVLALQKRVSDPERRGVEVKHTKATRDADSGTLSGVTISRSLHEDDFAELIGYYGALAGWIDELTRTGLISFPE